MRIGIFSDTHANYEALSAVLEAYRSEHIDCFYCLGAVSYTHLTLPTNREV